jgi:hypothetical protein
VARKLDQHFTGPTSDLAYGARCDAGALHHGSDVGGFPYGVTVVPVGILPQIRPVGNISWFPFAEYRVLPYAPAMVVGKESVAPREYFERTIFTPSAA